MNFDGDESSPRLNAGRGSRRKRRPAYVSNEEDLVFTATGAEGAAAVATDRCDVSPLPTEVSIATSESAPSGGGAAVSDNESFPQIELEHPPRGASEAPGSSCATVSDNSNVTTQVPRAQVAETRPSSQTCTIYPIRSTARSNQRMYFDGDESSPRRKADKGARKKRKPAYVSNEEDLVFTATGAEGAAAVATDRCDVSPLPSETLTPTSESAPSGGGAAAAGNDAVDESFPQIECDTSEVPRAQVAETRRVFETYTVYPISSPPRRVSVNPWMHFGGDESSPRRSAVKVMRKRRIAEYDCNRQGPVFTVTQAEGAAAVATDNCVEESSPRRTAVKVMRKRRITEYDSNRQGPVFTVTEAEGAAAVATDNCDVNPLPTEILNATSESALAGAAATSVDNDARDESLPQIELEHSPCDTSEEPCCSSAMLSADMNVTTQEVSVEEMAGMRILCMFVERAWRKSNLQAKKLVKDVARASREACMARDERFVTRSLLLSDQRLESELEQQLRESKAEIFRLKESREDLKESLGSLKEERAQLKIKAEASKKKVKEIETKVTAVKFDLSKATELGADLTSKLFRETQKRQYLEKEAVSLNQEISEFRAKSKETFHSLQAQIQDKSEQIAIKERSIAELKMEETELLENLNTLGFHKMEELRLTRKVEDLRYKIEGLEDALVSTVWHNLKVYIKNPANFHKAAIKILQFLASTTLNLLLIDLSY